MRQCSFIFGFKIPSAQNPMRRVCRLLRHFALVALFGQSGAHAAYRSSHCSGPLRSCCLFKRVHQLLYAVIAFSLLFALPALSTRVVDRVEQVNCRIASELPTFSAHWQVVHNCCFVTGFKSINYAITTCITAMNSTLLVWGTCTLVQYSYCLV